MIGYSRAFNELYGPKPIEGKSKMNERIKEFAKHHLVRDEHTEFGWQECHKYEFDPDELAKFAELIVRECANQATWYQDTNAKDIGGKLLEYFGVEE